LGCLSIARIVALSSFHPPYTSTAAIHGFSLFKAATGNKEGSDPALRNAFASSCRSNESKSQSTPRKALIKISG